ncbi:MAG: dihydrodipicolinate synthase family protein [Microbacteriaceae bacterium]
MFSGLSAFPLTPFQDGKLDEASFERQLVRLGSAGVDSICVLGSTGSAAYLRPDERRRVTELAVKTVDNIPVLVGVGAVSTRDVLQYVNDAQEFGAAGILLAPLSYQPLRDEEVFALFEKVSKESDLPLIVYDNPTTTKFTFSDDLYARIADLPGIASIKIPGVPNDPEAAQNRISELRKRIPTEVSLGISGDWMAASGLLAGCDVWYSVLAGVFPQPCIEITKAARSGNVEYARELSDKLEPVWKLFKQFGSYRVISTIAKELAIAGVESLHHPVLPLTDIERSEALTAFATLLR